MGAGQGENGSVSGESTVDVDDAVFEELGGYVDQRRIEKFGAVEKAPAINQYIELQATATGFMGDAEPVVFTYHPPDQDDHTATKDLGSFTRKTSKSASALMGKFKAMALKGAGVSPIVSAAVGAEDESETMDGSSGDRDSDLDDADLAELHDELAARDRDGAEDASVGSTHGLSRKLKELSIRSFGGGGTSGIRTTSSSSSGGTKSSKQLPPISDVGTTHAADETDDPAELLPRQCTLLPPGYTRGEANLNVEFTSAAYCKVHNGAKFECGCPIPALNFEFTGRYVNATTDSSGFVGVHRKNNYIVAGFRGTVSLKNWSYNAKAAPISGNKQKSEVGLLYKDLPDDVKLHAGFFRSFEAIGGDMLKEVMRLHRLHPSHQVYVTGHSLGGAMATHLALTLVLAGVPEEKLACYTFGQPRVGNEGFRREFDARVKNMFRIVNNYDAVPHLPAYGAGFRHVGHELWFSSKLTAAQRKALLTKNSYAGTEDRAEIAGLMDACANTIPFSKLGIADHLLYYDRIMGVHRLRGAAPSKVPVKPDGRVELVSDNFVSSVLSRTENVLVWEYTMKNGKSTKNKKPFQQLIEYARKLALEEGVYWNLKVVQINVAVNDLPKQFAPVKGQSTTVYFVSPAAFPPPPPVRLDGPVSFESLKALVEAHWGPPLASTVMASPCAGI